MTPFGVILARPGGKKAIKTNVFLTFLSSPFLVLLTSFGPLLGPSWRSLGSLLAPLGLPWAPQEVPWVPMGSPGGRPNPSWIHLGAILGPLFASSSPYGASMAHFETNLVHFSSNLHAFRVSFACETSNSHVVTELEIRATGASLIEDI